MDYSSIRIRNADASDIPSMVGLLRELFAIEADFQFDESCQASGLQRFLDGCGRHRCIRVAEVRDYGVVGMCTVQTVVSTAEGGSAALVEDLVVHPDYQRQGIGARLLRAIEDWVSRRGIHRMQLLADQNNTAALNFYARHQWRETRLVCRRKRI